MQKDVDVGRVSQHSADAVGPSSSTKAGSSSTYQLRVALAGFSILALSFLAGIFMSFREWDRGSPFNLSNWGACNPVGRATYGPWVFALVLLPMIFPVLIVLTVPIYIGLKRKKLWPLSLLGFLGIGMLWLVYIQGLWEID
jgi:hypothetical protein